MLTEVPYLPEKRIERDTTALLAEYEQARGVQIHPPIPIDSIIGVRRVSHLAVVAKGSDGAH
jgi:hypothetical protein